MIEKVYYWVDALESEYLSYFSTDKETRVYLNEVFETEDKAVQALDTFLSYDKWHYKAYELKCKYRKSRT